MSISSELTALQQDITNARTKITEKGGTITPSGGSSQLATDIATIPTGITPSGNIALTATTSTQTGINVTNYATASVAPTPSESKTLTLGSSAPSTVSPSSGKLLSSVPVSIDNTVIKAENIAQGATILGIAGTHAGGGGSKYGATINGILGNTDANGNYIIPTEQTSLDFTGIKSVPEYSFYYKFYRMPNIVGVLLPDLTTVGSYAFQYTFYSPNAEDGNIVTLNMNNLVSVGSYGLQYAFYYQKLTNQVINLSQLISVSQYAFNYALAYTKVTEFHADAITSIAAGNSFANFLSNATANSVDVSFNNLQSIKGNNIFAGCFYQSTAGAGTVFHPFKKLQKINGYSNFNSAFIGCTAKRFVFDKLEYIGDETTSTYTTFQLAFQYANMTYETGHDNDYDRIGLFCPVLKIIGQNSTNSRQNFNNAFTGSNNKHTAHFYELTTIYNTSSTATYGQFNQFNAKRVYMPKVSNMGTNNKNCFNSSTLTEEIHFGKENEVTIQAMAGYSTKFGATNATLYFDMANHIVVNGTTYDRYGAGCDLDNWYFAWKDSNDNIIYTTDFKDPIGLDTYTRSGTAGSYVYTATGDTVASST